jgi:uncharacterized protein DUF3305
MAPAWVSVTSINRISALGGALIHNPHQYQTMPLGVVLRKTPGVTRWARWTWQAVAVLPGAGAADWHLLCRDGETVDYHIATPFLELHGAESEAYLSGLSDRIPSIYTVLRQSGDDDRPWQVLLVTASPYEAQDYADNGEDLVEKIPMPEGLIAWIRDFAQKYHEHETFVKRRRDRQRIDTVEDGVGDARIPQLTDVYRAPHTPSRKETLN